MNYLLHKVRQLWGNLTWRFYIRWGDLTSQARARLILKRLGGLTRKERELVDEIAEKLKL